VIAHRWRSPRRVLRHEFVITVKWTLFTSTQGGGAAPRAVAKSVAETVRVSARMANLLLAARPL
jgi:hypothetical protein